MDKIIFFFIAANPLHKIVVNALNEAMKYYDTLIDRFKKIIVFSILTFNYYAKLKTCCIISAIILI